MVQYKVCVSKVATFTPIGDWFLLNLISQNVDELTFVRLMQPTTGQKSGLLDTPYGIKMEQIESTNPRVMTSFLEILMQKKSLSLEKYIKNDEYSCDDSGLGEDDGKIVSDKQTRKTEAPGGGLGIVISGKRKQEAVPTYVRQQEEASIFPDEVICKDYCQTLQITRNQESHQNSVSVKLLKPQLCKKDAINQESADSTPP